MAEKTESNIEEISLKLLQESKEQIEAAIDHIRDKTAPNAPMVAKPAPEVHSINSSTSSTDTPDKVNEIRSQVASVESPLSAEKQSKLMEIVDQKGIQFERELQDMTPTDKETVEAEVQKFKNRLTDFLRHELEEKKYILGK